MKPFTEDERYNYPITLDSIVIDAGAYHGNFAKRIWDTYKCRVFAYEPITEFHALASKTLQNTQVQLFSLGIAGDDGIAEFGVANDSTGAFKADAPKERVYLRSIVHAIDGAGGSIDLLKLNIEGGEYGVLQKLIETGYVTRCRNIQVQFHWFQQFDPAPITAKLAETHHLTFDAGPYIWQNWEINQ